MDIGNRIVKLRNAKGWNQKELARRVNINVSVMNRIESGERPVKDHELVIISNVLGVTSDYLLGKSEHLHEDGSANKDSIIGKLLKEFPDADLMFNDLANMTAEQLEEVYDFIKFKLHKK